MIKPAINTNCNKEIGIFCSYVSGEQKSRSDVESKILDSSELN
jgi:predicted nucleotidyltransferase